MSSFTSLQKAQAIVPKFSGLLSLVGALFICQSVIRKKLKTPYQRLLLGLSAADFLFSLVFIMSTWPMPKGMAFLAAGTVTTCSVQGFFAVAAGRGTILYNTILALYYLLTVGYGWKDERITKFELPWTHLVVNLFCWGPAIAYIPLELYNLSGPICFVSGHPMGCDNNGKNGGNNDLNDTTNTNPESPACERGENAWKYLVVEVALRFVCLSLVTVLMALMYYRYYNIEAPSRKYQYRTDRQYAGGQEQQQQQHQQKQPQQPSRSRRLLTQCLLYVAVFYLTWIFAMINNISLSRYGTRIPAIDMMVVIFTPLQGWWNFFVYIRPRYVRCQSMYPMLSWRQRLYIVFELKDPPSKNELHAIRMIQHARREQKKAKCQEPLVKETQNAAETEISIEKISKVNLPDSENCSNNLSNASGPTDKPEPPRDANEDDAAAVVTTTGTVPPANEPTNGDGDKHGGGDDVDSDDSLHLDEY